MPDVVGKRSEQRGADPPERGFEVDVVPIQSDTVREDRVAGQDPSPARRPTRGRSVTINVSSGPGEAPVPLVQGMPADEATEELRDAGFKSERAATSSPTRSRTGRVIETSPAEGSRCARARR